MQLTVKDVAKLLNVSEKTVYRWLHSGILPAYRVNDQYRFNRGELLEWATSRKIGTSIDFFREPESATAVLPSLVDALRDGGIYYRVGGKDKEEVLRTVVQTMRLPEEVDNGFLTQVLLAREDLGSTAVGDGIAIPHVRNPIVLHVNKPVIATCFLERAVDFGALDGKPVCVLFILISPTIRAHLHMLARLSYALQDQAFKAIIERQGSREDIMAAAARVEESIGSRSPSQLPLGT